MSDESSQKTMHRALQHVKAFSWKRFAIWNLGTLLIALGVYFFKFPNHLAMGGVSGISVIFAYFAPNLSASNAALILNGILLVIGYIFIGRSFSFATLYCTILLSVLLNFFEWICPMTAPLTDQPILELCFAILLPAIGTALLFNTFASSGGTDIVAMIVKKYCRLNIGRALLATDALIVMATYFIFGPKTGLMSALGLLAKSFMVDSVIENINQSKYFTIITKKPEVFDSLIKDRLHRSGTILKGKGMYSGEEHSVILCVVSRYQAVLLREAVSTIDPSAFIMITDTSQIIGKGFQAFH